MRLPITLLAASFLLTGCMVAQGYSEQEQSIVDSLDTGLYQPASRQARDNISTQSILAQATFWSREAQLNPADLESAVRLTSAVRKMGNASQAVDIAQMARSMHPTDPYLLAEYAASLIADERGSEAKKPLQQGLRSTPAYGRLWSLMGAALDQEEKYGEARRHYERALKITPNDPNVLANMGLSFALEGNAAVAEQWLRRAAAQPNASAGVEQNLALVLQLQGKPAQGQLAERKAAPSAPQYAQQPTWNRAQVQGPQTTRPNAYQSRPGQVASGQLSNGQNFSIGKGEPRSAMEAARMAAQKSQGRRTTVMDGQAAPQSYVLPQGQPQGYAQPQQGQVQGRVQGQVVQGQAQGQPQQGQVQGQYPVYPQGYLPQGYAQPQQAAPNGYQTGPAVRGRARGR